MTVNGSPFEVIGVVSRYRGWGTTKVGEIDLWLPIGTQRALTREAPSAMYTLVGRVRGRVSIEAIQQQLRAGYEGTRQTDSAARSRFRAGCLCRPVQPPSQYGRDEALRLYRLLMAGVALLLRWHARTRRICCLRVPAAASEIRPYGSRSAPGDGASSASSC